MSRTAFGAAAVVAALVIGGALFVIGRGSEPRAEHGSQAQPPGDRGSESDAQCDRADRVPQTTGAWIATGSMGTPRTDHTAIRLLDGRVLVVGGAVGVDNDTSAELYDPTDGTWSTTGSMLKPSAGPATLLLDGRVLVGDIDNPAADDPVEGSELYDPATGTWTATGTMVWGGFATATLLRDGNVLVRGNGGSELFDPDTGTWTATRSRPDAAPQPRGHPAARRPRARGGRPHRRRHRDRLGRAVRP